MAGIDTLAKRYFPAVICGLLASVAYLQGRGISSLIGQQLPTVAPPPVHAPTPKLDTANDPDKSAAIVLQRNAFDSVTGPITGRKPKPEAAPVATAPSTPGQAPECSSGSVVLIAGADDPSFAFAMIKTSGGKSSGSTMRRVGDDVDGKKVEAIGWDEVVLATGGDRCRLLMHDVKKSGAGATDPTGPSAPDFSSPSSAPGPVGPGASDPDIKKVSDNEFVLEHNGPGKLGEMQSAFMKTARVVPGKGIRLQRASQTTVLSQLGLKKGDMITTINGHDMTQPDSAMEAYGKLKTSKSVQIVLERDGKPMTIDYAVK